MRTLMHLSRLARRALALATAAALAACAAGDGAGSGTPTEPTGGTTPPPTSGQPSPSAGLVTGTIVDAAGRPLAGVRVVADNTLFYDSNVTGTTDAQGRYRLDLGRVPATWHMTAQVSRTYNGQEYTFDLHPDSDADFSGLDGAVRNFDWRLTGKRPELTDGYYGGTVYAHIDIFHWPDDADARDIEFTFTPVGPLVDGSTGPSLTLRAADGSRIPDVPVGKYTVTARLAPQGAAARPLTIRLATGGAYASAVTAVWPRDVTGRTSALDLQVSAPDQ
jgi:Carboxypeptidase regulatory-like domain